MTISTGYLKSYTQAAHPYQGNYKKIKSSAKSNEETDEYKVVALAKRLNITIDDMKQMSFVSLTNILLSSVEEESETQATQEDINKFFG